MTLVNAIQQFQLAQPQPLGLLAGMRLPTQKQDLVLPENYRLLLAHDTTKQHESARPRGAPREVDWLSWQYLGQMAQSSGVEIETLMEELGERRPYLKPVAALIIENTDTQDWFVAKPGTGFHALKGEMIPDWEACIGPGLNRFTAPDLLHPILVDGRDLMDEINPPYRHPKILKAGRRKFSLTLLGNDGLQDAMNLLRISKSVYENSGRPYLEGTTVLKIGEKLVVAIVGATYFGDSASPFTLPLFFLSDDEGRSFRPLSKKEITDEPPGWGKTIRLDGDVEIHVAQNTQVTVCDIGPHESVRKISRDEFNVRALSDAILKMG